MNFNDMKTEDLIECYKKINEFISLLEKEEQEIKKE